MKKYIKKILACVLITIVGVGTFTGCSKKESNVDGIKATKVRVAIQPAIGASTLLVAKENGFLEEELKEYGVEVEWTTFAAGPPMNESFAAGQQDIGYIGDVPLLIAKASGQSTRVIANAGYNPHTNALVIPADSDITDVLQLKGKKVAYVKGSFGHHLLGVLLQNAGLEFSDIEEINLPIGDIASTIEAGEADAGILWDPGLIKAVNAGQVKVLADGEGVKRNSCYYFATQSFIDDNPKIIEAYIKAIERANKLIASDVEKAAESITEITGLTKEELLSIFADYTFSPAINEEDIAQLKQVEEFLAEQDLISNEVDVDAFVENQYLKNVGIQ